MHELATFTNFLLTLAGLIGGLIDSIAGGGGLITLPTLTSILGPGPDAIGTNKIVGFMGALVAFIVYLRREHFNLRKGMSFVIAVGVGSFLGSLVNPLVPKIYFRYFLIALCPVVLIIVWNKKLFIQEVKDHVPRAFTTLLLTGLAAGFYDGFFGPGGGTFMLLGLLWAVRLPLFEALLLSKLSNTVSAGIALTSYAVQGYVHVKEGVMVAIGMTIGGYAGAKLASNRAEKVVRPVLALVVILLLLKQVQEVIAASAQTH
jgi:uncharacterized membrane protein YfcA